MNDKGQSLFEVVVALAISALVIVALVSLASTSIRNANFSKNKSLASTYALEAVEWLRGQRDSDVDTFFNQYAIVGQSYCLNSFGWSSSGNCASGSYIPGTTFTRQLNFENCTGCSDTFAQAKVVVSWVDAQGNHEISNVTNFSDWRER